MSSHKKKSFREIARELGLSPATVSRIANGLGSYAEETRSAVMGLLREEGYETPGPSTAGKSRIVAMVTDLSNELYNKILTSLTRYLDRQGYLLEIHVENQDQTSLFYELQNHHPDGMILVGTPLSLLSVESKVPVVQVLSNSLASWNGEVYSVFSDEYVGGRLAARKLLDHGCLAPVILNNRHTASHASLRIQGFLEEWTKDGHAAEDVYIHDGEPFKSAFNSAQDIISYLRAKDQAFDSVFACSDWRAYGAIVALHSMNVDIPGDVKVIGFDGERVSRYSSLPFTTIQQNPDMIASQAVTSLLGLIQNDLSVPRSVLIPVQVQKGLTA